MHLAPKFVILMIGLFAIGLGHGAIQESPDPIPDITATIVDDIDPATIDGPDPISLGGHVVLRNPDHHLYPLNVTLRVKTVEQARRALERSGATVILPWTFMALDACESTSACQRETERICWDVQMVGRDHRHQATVTDMPNGSKVCRDRCLGGIEVTVTCWPPPEENE